MKYFRVASVMEGLSYLVILSVSLGIISREFVFYIGMTHGVLFLVYLILSTIASHKQGWSVSYLDPNISSGYCSFRFYSCRNIHSQRPKKR